MQIPQRRAEKPDRGQRMQQCIAQSQYSYGAELCSCQGQQGQGVG